jgi:hypothetical protein
VRLPRLLPRLGPRVPLVLVFRLARLARFTRPIRAHCIGRLGCLVGLAACGAAPPAVVAPPVERAGAASFPDDPGPLLRYHSPRLSLSLPLPDGRSWRIDDHTRAELVATHRPTRSKIVLALFRTDELVGRTECEALANERKLASAAALRILEDETGITQQTFDTRTVVAVAAGLGPDQPLVGHVMAFGGFLRKCLVFDFSTEVDGAADEPVLSSRLAFARARILGGLELDPFGTVPREPHALPEGAPR